MAAAANKGLDFGIITNSAVDVALYSAMDSRERQKNVRIAETATLGTLVSTLLKVYYNNQSDFKNAYTNFATEAMKLDIKSIR